MLKFRNHSLFLRAILGALVLMLSGAVWANGAETDRDSCLYSLEAAKLPRSAAEWQVRENSEERVFTAVLGDQAFSTTTFTACDHFSQVSTLVVSRRTYTEDNGLRYLTNDEIADQIGRLADLAFSPGDATRIKTAVHGKNVESGPTAIPIKHDIYNDFRLTIQMTPALLIITISYAIS